eukprot:CAMPEP_0177583204 /NCGR_PEP_ID=MMETSP0419_2-20121207/3191_1 /TAXON_ID=582737 /ORGANISM="Tetraselmis sp., Strain GSL018" /LENGTH=358 /DNA_ID=CAMNT_0019072567 /DNA_START=109 /DNA_END=1185 /DNA_ORIENTATION=+
MTDEATQVTDSSGVVSLGVDIGIFCSAGVAAVFSIAGCFYIAPYRCCPDWLCGFCQWRAGMQEFNSLWLVRVSILLTSSVLMISQMLSLSAVWLPNSVIPLWQIFGVDPTGMEELCRLSLALSLGVAEPFLLLTTLFACLASSRRKPCGIRATSNLQILALALAATIPVALMQFAVAFSSAFLPADDMQEDQLLHYLVSVKQGREDSAICRADEVGVGGELGDRRLCISCLYPAASTMVSVFFVFAYLLSLWSVFDSMARAVLNRRLRRRLRVLQGLLTASLILGLALRGVGIVAGPNEVAFSMIRLCYFLTLLLYVEAICWTLVWWPILDARKADWRTELYWKAEELSTGSFHGDGD